MKVLKYAKQHKKESIILVAGTAVVGVGIWAYSTIKNRESKVVSDFRAALRVYIVAIRQGNMDIDKIDNLMTALEELKNNKDYDKIRIQLTADDLENLASRIYKYTIKLAQDNNVELTEGELNTAEMKNDGSNCANVDRNDWISSFCLCESGK